MLISFMLIKKGLYIRWNSPNGEMYEGHIWVGSTTQTESKMQATGKISSNR